MDLGQLYECKKNNPKVGRDEIMSGTAIESILWSGCLGTVPKTDIIFHAKSAFSTSLRVRGDVSIRLIIVINYIHVEDNTTHNAVAESNAGAIICSSSNLIGQ
jgi:hypothetical protein